MLVAVGPELEAAIALCRPSDERSERGWAVDAWRVDEAGVSALVDLYDAALAGGLGASSRSGSIEEALAAVGVDVRALLRNVEADLPRVTRADFSEFAAATSLLAIDGWPSRATFMPNSPKASRAKSESGIDVFCAEVDAALGLDAGLGNQETLRFASVKHTIQPTLSDMRAKLRASFTTEWTAPYVMSQLRVLHGHLESIGTKNPNRLYLHFAEHPTRTHIHAVAVVDSTQVDAFLDNLDFLPEDRSPVRRLRVVGIPELSTVHERCS